MQHEWAYLICVITTTLLMFFIESILKITRVVVYRYFTAIMYSFYIIILPLGLFLLLNHPHRWQLYKPLPSSFLILNAMTIGFYLYAIIRLRTFPNKRRNLPEMYHHIVFSVCLGIVLFIPKFSLIIFAWFYLQQLAILPYYVTYILSLQNKIVIQLWFFIDLILFFIFKIVLIVALLFYLLLNFDFVYENMMAYYFAFVFFVVSLLFNIYWGVIKLSRAAEYYNNLTKRNS